MNSLWRRLTDILPVFRLLFWDSFNLDSVESLSLVGYGQYLYGHGHYGTIPKEESRIGHCLNSVIDKLGIVEWLLML